MEKNKIKIETNGAISKMYINGEELRGIQYLKFEHKKAEELATIDVRLVPTDCEVEAIDTEYNIITSLDDKTSSDTN